MKKRMRADHIDQDRTDQAIVDTVMEFSPDNLHLGQVASVHSPETATPDRSQCMWREKGVVEGEHAILRTEIAEEIVHASVGIATILP